MVLGNEFSNDLYIHCLLVLIFYWLLVVKSRFHALPYQIFLKFSKMLSLSPLLKLYVLNVRHVIPDITELWFLIFTC